MRIVRQFMSSSAFNSRGSVAGAAVAIVILPSRSSAQATSPQAKRASVRTVPTCTATVSRTSRP
jgi:hypothetical protein